jgi:hypothetical protein
LLLLILYVGIQHLTYWYKNLLLSKLPSMAT